jgi:asparagine synthetase B (glutamine-hydrolysing)
VSDRSVLGSQVLAFDRPQRDQYLAFGFVPELPEGDPLALLAAWSRRPRRSPRSVSESALVREGVTALRAAFEDCATQVHGRGDQVVLLSGGLDSRAILGALLELYGPGEILTATFGSPGEQDFDFAAGVARAAGVRHEVLETFSVDWTTEGLVDSVLARQVPLPHPFGQRYLSYRLHQRIGVDNTFWDGLAGDQAGGVVTQEADGRSTWAEAVQYFLDLHLLPHWADYTGPGLRPESVLPAAPFVSDSLLTYRDQLLFAVRQARYTGTRRLRGYTVQTPFLSRPWLDFMLSVPLRYRVDRRLYMTILRTAYPRLFALPTTTLDGAGVPLSPLVRRAVLLQRRALRKARRLGRRSPAGGPPSPGANALRRSHLHRADIRALILDNLADLAGRDVVAGLDPQAIGRAMAGRTISDTRISVLLGLELNLKAVDRLAEQRAGAR